MAQLRIRTRTYPYTFSRIDLLRAQVRIALRRSMVFIDEDTLKRVIDQGISEKYISQIDIYGIDARKMCRAQLKLKIDWQKHQLHIVEGRAMVGIRDDWTMNPTLEVDELTKLFRDFVDEKRLDTYWTFNWRAGVDVQVARKKLGTGAMDKEYAWRRTPQELTYSVRSLDELSVGCYLDI